jgi:hypothetical protein
MGGWLFRAPGLWRTMRNYAEWRHKVEKITRKLVFKAKADSKNRHQIIP